jgi:hypothetical protein
MNDPGLPRPTPKGPDGYIVAGVLLLIVCPSALLAWLWAAWARRAGHRYAPLILAAGVGICAMLLRGVLGAVYVDLAAGYAAAAGRGSWAILGAAAVVFCRHLVLTAPIGLPIGMMAGHLTTPRRIVPAVPLPTPPVTGKKSPVKVERSPLLARAVESKPPGDLPAEWYRGRYLVLPQREAGQSRIIVGRPGSGKSELIYRETYLAGRIGERNISIDCKGEETYPREIVNAYVQGWVDGGQPGQPSIHLWPSEPLSAWTGGPVAVVNRLLACWTWDPRSLFYREILSKALQLAMTAPGPEVTSSVELLERLRPGGLERLWEEYPEQSHDLRAFNKDNRLDEVRLRVSNLMAALGHHLDGDPARPLGTADLTVISLPVMAAEEDANSILRVMLADLAFYVVARKTPGERVLVVVDEMSAVEGGRRHMIHVAERGRSAGVAVVMAVQSDAGLGDDQDANRLLGAVNTVALFNTAEPERLIRLAGTRRQVEQTSTSTNDDGHSTYTSNLVWVDQVDANVVRALPVGHAFLMSRGRAQLAEIIQAPKGPPDGGPLLELEAP